MKNSIGSVVSGILTNKQKIEAFFFCSVNDLYFKKYWEELYNEKIPNDQCFELMKPTDFFYNFFRRFFIFL